MADANAIYARVMKKWATQEKEIFEAPAPIINKDEMLRAKSTILGACIIAEYISRGLDETEIEDARKKLSDI